jgi:hypothetical protein
MGEGCVETRSVIGAENNVVGWLRRGKVRMENELVLRTFGLRSRLDERVCGRGACVVSKK